MRSPIHSLRQRKADLTKKAEGLLAQAKTEGRDLSGSESQEHDRIIAQLRANEEQLVKEEKKLLDENELPADLWMPGNGAWRPGDPNQGWQGHSQISAA